MSIDFFINTQINLTQNTNLYGHNADTTSNALYDYILTVSTRKTGNDIFDTKRYVQNVAASNDAGEDKYDVSLTINRAHINEYLLGQNVAIATGTVAPTPLLFGQEAGDKLFGLRLLEIMAMKIFGHSKARAAISNDSEFYRGNNVATSIVNQLIAGVQTGLDAHQCMIFNAYVQSDRIQTDANSSESYNDVDSSYAFNFSTTNWEFPVHLKGNLIDAVTGTSSSISGSLNNGPIVGGNQLLGGLYDIPILVRFVSTA